MARGGGVAAFVQEVPGTAQACELVTTVKSKTGLLRYGRYCHNS